MRDWAGAEERGLGERTLLGLYDGGAVTAVVGRCRLTLSNPVLNPPGAQRLKLTCDDLLSNFAFNFNLCRYTVALSDHIVASGGRDGFVHVWRIPAGADMVGRCRLTL